MESKLDGEPETSSLILGLGGVAPKLAFPPSFPSEGFIFFNGGGPGADDCMSPRILERTSLFFSDT